MGIGVLRDAKTPLPAVAVKAFAYSLPSAEGVVGFFVIVGLWTRSALLLGALIMAAYRRIQRVIVKCSTLLFTQRCWRYPPAFSRLGGSDLCERQPHDRRTAGTAPSPLLKSLPLEKDKRGALLVDATLAVPGHPGLWGIGDCAAVTDAATGQRCPPTAQFALREAEIVASNIHAQLEGRSARRFHFDSLGAFCVVGCSLPGAPQVLVQD
jgi:hypothetical protein